MLVAATGTARAVVKLLLEMFHPFLLVEVRGNP
jgi:hypothetical protein